MYPNIRDLSLRFPLVLASGSPRRRQLLDEIGCRFTISTHEIDETQQREELPFAFALRLAKEKALAVASDTGSYVLGCDTIVVIEGTVLGKPRSEDEAFAMLKTLSGNHHEVCTAIAFAGDGRIVESGYDVTGVYFHRVTDRQIRDYVAAGEPMDKAGAYGIQGMGGFLVDRIEGNLDTVIGLPRDLLDQLAAALLRKP
jgi:septum formation protein